MSSQVPKIATSWRKKSEVDYFPLFVPLWLAFDAWLRANFNPPTTKNSKIPPSDRERLETLKYDYVNNDTFEKMQGLLVGANPRGGIFKEYLLEIEKALLSAPIKYENDSANRIISFSDGLVDRESKTRGEYENLMDVSNLDPDDPNVKIELTSGRFIINDVKKIYRVYLEILYQVRCRFFHGELEPNKDNERIIKYLYLTLSEIFEA